MKQKALGNEEKLLLRKRSVIETVNDKLKNICHPEQTLHRSMAGFILNIMDAIAAYSFFPKKLPSKNIWKKQTNQLLPRSTSPNSLPLKPNSGY